MQLGDDEHERLLRTDVDVDDQYGTVKKRDKGSVLSYHNVTYTLKVKDKGFACCAKHKRKEILRDLRLTFSILFANWQCWAV